MGAGADDRLRGGLIAGLALAALAAGGWWWRAAAPASGPVPAALSSAPAPVEQSPVDRFLVDPENGYIIQATGADPDEPLVLHQKSGAAMPEVSHVVWEDRSRLAAGDVPLARQSSSSYGERHMLVVTCSGSGALTVTIAGSLDDRPGQRVPCSGSPTTLALTSAGGPLLVRFTAADGAVDLDARLVAVF
ncbi:hypothetical protein GA0070624_0470 [Micromonospora rhizosphaerae]|uniref:Uncharacterized protein n=1 Tax=Micromonospora rhizosphaerae TaxID=568872 RepID=A0A1C6RC08_9ACTN|nr:hypothetical protein [Micromonospora rhizosphaerae]SCL14594.1 hypothetical protein GA0070624_0470 [Micromonospora rhizosphaerae]